MDLDIIRQLIREHANDWRLSVHEAEESSSEESEEEEEEEEDDDDDDDSDDDDDDNDDDDDDDDDDDGVGGEERGGDMSARAAGRATRGASGGDDDDDEPSGPVRGAKRRSGGRVLDGEEEEEDDESGGGKRGAKGKKRRENTSGGGGGGAGGGAAGSAGAAGGGKGKKARKKKKTKEKANAAIDAAVRSDCSYNPDPWSKRQKRSSANTIDMLRARAQGFNTRRMLSAPLGRGYIPNTFCRPLGPSHGKMFCGRFSTSGDVLLTASQDSIINLYDSESVYQWSSKPEDDEIDYRDEFRVMVQHMFRNSRLGLPSGAAARGRRAWKGAPKPIKTIRCLDTQWSVISTDFSPDERWLAYSSWSPYVHLCNTRGDYELHEALDFQPLSDHFCLFSIQFSPSNTHILGGGSDHRVYLYSLERKERVARISAHNDDVNAVAFADSGSQVVLSGGDDSVIKIWDLRSPYNAVGGLCGHQAGVTCITAKGDGHHFISNGKDQTMKLWDMRKMLNPKDEKMVKAASVRQQDYRHMPMTRMRRPKRNKRGADESVKTFHGHKVLQTLIRCYFSPAHTTGQRFVMSGSSDGRVCIWDILTGEMVESLSWHNGNTRDVSWHPHLPLIASFSWDAAVGLWTFGGAKKEEKLQQQQQQK